MRYVSLHIHPLKLINSP
jgi:hypothetical protein